MAGSTMSAEDRPASRTRWGRGDTIAFSLVTALAGIVRVVRATSPPGGVFDEGYYAKEGCLAVLSASGCGGDTDLSSGHPPLGSLLIGVGIRLFGYRTGGWRAAPLVAGTLTVALLFLLARRLLRSTLGATLASGLLALEFLHVVHSRTAMLDVFVAFFAVAGVLFVVCDAGRIETSVRRRIRRPWRAAAGVAGGAAAATKWSGVPILLGLVALTLLLEAHRRRTAGVVHPVRAAFRGEVSSVIALLVVLPALVYVAAHIGQIDGALIAAPWSQGSWIRAFFDRHVELVDLQSRLGPLGSENPYTSPAWSWPLIARPVTYFFEPDAGGYREVLALGSPLVWWGSIPAMGTIAIRWARSRSLGGPDAVIVVATLATWGPWLVLSPARSYMFLFYMLPAVPFMCLAVASAALSLRRARVAVVAALLAGSVALFAFFYPVLTALRLSPDAWERRIWFGYAACGIERPAPNDLPARPLLEDRNPPKGWCWI